MENALLFVSGIFGNAFGVFLFLASLSDHLAVAERIMFLGLIWGMGTFSVVLMLLPPQKINNLRITFKRTVKRRSTEQFSRIPYVMTLLNCLLSAWYSMPFVSRNNLLAYSTIERTSAAIESVYVLIFLTFWLKKEKGKILGLLALVLTVFAAVVFVSLLALPGKNRKLFCGIAATIFSITMYGSPLMVTIPNGFGCGLGAVQLILYAIYRGNKGQTDQTATA